MGPRKMLLSFMDQMRIEQLFSEGKYMVIYLEPETILPRENEQFLHVRCFKFTMICLNKNINKAFKQNTNKLTFCSLLLRNPLSRNLIVKIMGMNTSSNGNPS